MRAAHVRGVIGLTGVVAASVMLVGCVSCPDGDLVDFDRSVSFAFTHEGGSGSLSGQGSSAPTGLAISFDRATLRATGVQPPASSSDLVLVSEAAGCHLDPGGQRLCDQKVEIRLTVHDVKPGPAAIALDDQRALLQVEITDMLVPTGPCPGKMIEGVRCLSPEDIARAKGTGPVAYTGIRGQLDLSQLNVDCANVLAECSLQTSGTFTVTANGPQAAVVQLTSGTFMAADQRHARPPEACHQ